MRVMLGVVAGGFAFVGLLCSLTSFSTSDAQYRDTEGNWHTLSLPLRLQNKPEGTYVVRFTAHGSLWSPTLFSLQPDDCLQMFTVDDEPVPGLQLPYCDYAKPIEARIPELRGGTHRVSVEISNNGGDALFSLEPAGGDPATFIRLGVLTLWLLASAFAVLWWRGAAAWVWHTSLVFLLGVGIRAVYVLQTPHWTRGHDTDGHIEYIRYLLDHGALPPPDGGWEFWQPPLYYLLGALWWLAGDLFGLGDQAQLLSLQWLGFTLSLVTLGLALWIGVMAVKRRELLALWMAPFALLPSLVFLAARINNDVLVLPLTLLSIALLLKWLSSPRLGYWVLAAFTAGLAVLTKNTSLLLLPIAFFFLFLRKWERFWHPVTHILIGGLIIALTAGWFSVYRVSMDTGQGFMVGNQGTLNSGLAVPNDADAFLTFNPVAMTAHPFNNAWSDDARRQHFYEYLYRSAFFGEFDLGKDRELIASWLVLSGLLLLALCVVGFVVSLYHRKKREWVPMLILLVILLLGHTAFRILYPFSSSQDFRYSLPLLVPFAYFLCAVFEERVPREIRKTAEVLIYIAGALCIIVLLSL